MAAPAAPTDPADLVEEVGRMLRARGERLTGPRRAVLTALAAGGGHLSAEQVIDRVAQADPSVHRTSVYRTLDALSELGVVQHVHLGHGPTAYHLVGGHAHVHAQCRGCGTILDLPAGLLDEVAQTVRQRYGFVLDAEHVALSGTCARCAADRG